MEKLKLNHIKIKNIMICRWEKPNLKKKEEISLDHARFTHGFLVAKRENSTIIECSIRLKIQQTFESNATAL